MIRSTLRLSLLVALVAVTLTVASVASAEELGTNVTERFRSAAEVDRLQAVEIAGMLILRGRVTNRAAAEAVGAHAVSLGYTRVANLIQTVAHDDAKLTRAAERALATNRSLDGCQFSVRSDRGVVRVAGTVRHELQKDVAMQMLRSINGVERLEVDLIKRF